MINKVGLPRITLPMFLNFSQFDTFRDESLGTIWDFDSFNMDESNVNES
jgi:hypothetical protein